MINLNKFKANVSTVGEIKTNRNKVTTIDEARKKVADKLEANLKYIENNMCSTEKIDTVFTEKNGVYTLGAKYGNRWLHDVFGKGQHYVTGLSYDELEETVDVLTTCVLQGEADDAIKAIMENNKRKKTA